jgi:hypothetical protein
MTFSGFRGFSKAGEKGGGTRQGYMVDYLQTIPKFSYIEGIVKNLDAIVYNEYDIACERFDDPSFLSKKTYVDHAGNRNSKEGSAQRLKGRRRNIWKLVDSIWGLF